MFAGCSWFDKNFHFVFAFLLYYLHFTLCLSIFTLFVYVYDYVSMSTSRFTAFHLHLIMWSIFKEHFHYNEPFNLIKVDTCFSLIVFAHFLEYPLYSPLVNPCPENSHLEYSHPCFWILPPTFFNVLVFSLSRLSLTLLKRLFCSCIF